MSDAKSTSARRSTEEIPFDQWIPFLAAFTRENRGAHARLDVLGGEVGYRVETEDLPFDGVSADQKDREHTVWIAFGSTLDNHISHGVHGAKAIRTLPQTETAGPVLEVDADDGSKTVLQLTRLGDYALPDPNTSGARP